jgi:hypothetical protein
MLLDRASKLLSTGKGVPRLSQVEQGEKLYKAVPKGDKIKAYSPFFTDQIGRDKQVLGKSNIADSSALPNQSSAAEFDIYSISPKPNQRPTVFKSEVAPIEQGSVKRKGGAQQTIVPERSLFENPVYEETIRERFDDY